jgi:hypothetical protein
LEASAAPQRVRRGDGSWVPIDTSLARAADGALAPRAVTQPLTLSAGHRAADERTHGRRGAWPTALPTASVEGDTAVYRDVHPGVDLRVRALAAVSPTFWWSGIGRPWQTRRCEPSGST